MQYVKELQDLIKENSKISEMKGCILYSSVETLKKGKFYFLGINPGGDGGSPLVKIDASCTENAYLDQDWLDYEVGQAPLQTRVVKLFHEFGLDMREVCASNLIFQQTQNIKELKNIFASADACFPIHQHIIEEIVKPKFIISMGRVVFDYFVHRQGYSPLLNQEFLAGHGKWKIRIATKDERTMINLPHLSYYSPFSFSPQTQEAKQKAVARLKEFVS